jgi:ubiquitin C-terminal hydrolase
MDYCFYDASYSPMPNGMENTGIICWCNSLIQVMLGFTSLNQYLIKNKETMKKNVFAKEYINLVEISLGITEGSMWNSSHKILVAFEKEMRKRNSRIIFGNMQECTHEAFILFLDIFNNEGIKRLFRSDYEMAINCNNCGKKTFYTRDHALNIDYFNRDYDAIQTHNDFVKYLKAEISFMSEFACKYCEYTETKVPYLIKLKKLREIIIIIFDKFHRKRHAFFPEEMKIKSTDNSYLIYKLIGKINHNGTMNSGHYYAHCFRREQWFCINDTAVNNGTSTPENNTFLVAYHLSHILYE